jgi:putative peptidoglycan lipid II flippase
MMTPEDTVALPVQETPQKSQGLLKTAGIMAGLLLLSKLAGFARDVMIAQTYGFSLITDAYFAAFQLPQFSLILLGGLGGPFHTATVSIFTQLLEKNPNGTLMPSLKAKELASTLTTLTGLVFALLSVVVYFTATPIMGFILGSEAKPELVAMSAQQLQVMSPIILIGGLVGFLYGALNMLHVYVWPALSPVVMSVVMMAGLWIWGAEESGLMLAWASLLGAILQWLLQVPEFLGKGFSFMPRLKDWRSPEAQQWYVLLWPAVLGSTMGQLMIYVDMFFTGYLPEGAWSAVVFSNRLIQLPLGVLQTALLVPLFPRLVTLVNEKNESGLASLLVKGIGGLWFLAFPMMLILGLSPLPFIQTLFGYGNFEQSDASLLGLAIAWQSLQIIPYFARDTMTRVFYAYQDSKTPMLVGLVAIALKALLNYLFIIHLNMGVAGITSSITMITLFNLIVLSFLLKRQHFTSLPVLPLFVSLVKLTLASLPMVGMLWVSRWTLPFLPDSLESLAWMEALWTSILTLGVGGVLYLGACHLLGIQEVQDVMQRLKWRLHKT